MLHRPLLSASALVGAAVLFPAQGLAQYAERPDAVGSGSPAVDCSGRSIKNKRVRAIHDPLPIAGGTGYFLQRDPFLGYQLGRNLNFREFRTRDGVFSEVANLGGPMPDGTTAKITANNQTSCSGCHNLPQGNPGGGTNFHKDSGLGRQAPHYYGAGLVEMIAIQVRADILAIVDTNADGWVSASEAQAAPNPVVVDATLLDQVSYGNPRLSSGSMGEPNLNNIFRVWYVDANGMHVPGATEVDGITTFGYNFNMIVWGWGQGSGRAALNPTNRAFYWDPANAHTGMQAHDPSTSVDLDGDGVSEPTLAGAIQFPATHLAPDAGSSMDVLGFSRDDPDGDGYLSEVSEGDLDLAEWFMLNIPRPAFAGTPKEFRAGVRAMDELGCTECHTTRWWIQAADGVHAGDRRLFDLEVTWNSQGQRLEGKLVSLFQKVGEDYFRDLGSFGVTGIFSDFKHHDMGAGFRETDFGGNYNTIWRTPPLWGVASGFPWGHDGQSLTLEDAITRHDGEGAASKAAWLAATPGKREQVLKLLRKLVLYDIESLPADIDNDGVIATNYVVAGKDTGVERFNAEWLFKVPVEIQGPVVNTDGLPVHSFSGLNISDAYAETMRCRIDSDSDGWPDMWDHAPNTPGYKDGVN